MRSVADGAGDFSDSHLRGGIAEARDIALIFGKPVGDFQAEGDGLRVDAVSAPDLRRVAKFVSARSRISPNVTSARSINLDASRTWRACAVSTTSFDVMP